MAFAKFEGNRFIIDGEIAKKHAILGSSLDQPRLPPHYTVASEHMLLAEILLV